MHYKLSPFNCKQERTLPFFFFPLIKLLFQELVRHHSQAVVNKHDNNLKTVRIILLLTFSELCLAAAQFHDCRIYQCFSRRNCEFQQNKATYILRVAPLLHALLHMHPFISWVRRRLSLCTVHEQSRAEVRPLPSAGPWGRWGSIVCRRSARPTELLAGLEERQGKGKRY